MGSERKYNVDFGKLRKLLDAPKSIYENIEFTTYPRKKNKENPTSTYQMWQSSYVIIGDDIADDLYMRVKCIRYPTFAYHSFLLQYTYQKQQNIIIQLEVYPDILNSHTEPNGKRFYGTHIHELNKVYEVRPAGYLNFSWYDWLSFFGSKANITLDGRHLEPILETLDL